MTEIFVFEVGDGYTVAVSEYGLAQARCSAQRALIRDGYSDRQAYIVHKIDKMQIKRMDYIITKPAECPFCGKAMTLSFAESDPFARSTTTVYDCTCGASITTTTVSPPEAEEDEDDD